MRLVPTCEGASLRDYALPKIGRKPVNSITTADVMSVLLPIWSTKRETARRVRQRIGAVMKWAVAQGYREDNPAGDAISAALPKNANSGLGCHLDGGARGGPTAVNGRPCRRQPPVARRVLTAPLVLGCASSSSRSLPLKLSL